jgi:hypothetical protein
MAPPIAFRISPRFGCPDDDDHARAWDAAAMKKSKSLFYGVLKVKPC